MTELNQAEYIQKSAESLMAHASVRERPDVWLWTSVIRNTEVYKHSIERRANAPRKNLGHWDDKATKSEDATIAALASFIMLKNPKRQLNWVVAELLDLRENEFSLEDLTFNILDKNK